jgi:uncharacterized membrane protein
MKKRFEELDLLRGGAIVGMVIYHLLFILNLFGVYGVNLEFTLVEVFAGLVRFDFLALVGVGMVISYYRILVKGRGRWWAILQQWKRGLLVGGCAMVVTAATYFYVPGDFVRFGILHLIALSIFFWSFFVEWKWLALVLSVVSFWVGGWFEWMSFGGLDFSGVWFGYFLRDMVWNLGSVDYFPMFPWVGVVGIGVFLGHVFYPRGVQRFEWKVLNGNGLAKKGVCFLGRHSLAVYIIHVPVIMVVLWALGLVQI